MKVVHNQAFGVSCWCISNEKEREKYFFLSLNFYFSHSLQHQSLSKCTVCPITFNSTTIQCCKSWRLKMGGSASCNSRRNVVTRCFCLWMNVLIQFNTNTNYQIHHSQPRWVHRPNPEDQINRKPEDWIFNIRPNKLKSKDQILACADMGCIDRVPYFH